MNEQTKDRKKLFMVEKDNKLSQKLVKHVIKQGHDVYCILLLKYSRRYTLYKQYESPTQTDKTKKSMLEMKRKSQER